MQNNEVINYTVVEKRHISANVYTITLTHNGSVPKFIAGQYINIYFRDTGTPEGKAYTISSAPMEGVFEITVKVIGEFSGRIAMLEPGDVVSGSLPYGYFCSEATDSPLVMLAAGIGVTPFRSMIVDSLLKESMRPLHLFHSAKTAEELVFRNEFEELLTKYHNFTVHYFVTKEAPRLPRCVGRRMTGQDIVENISVTPVTEFLVCGSISFTRDMWHSLQEVGVDEEAIYTEAFFSH